MNGNSRKITKWLIATGIIIGIAIIGICIYQCPQEKKFNVTLSNTEGETIQAAFDIVLHPYILAETKITGSITIDGVAYQSFHNTSGSQELDMLLHELWGKWSGSPALTRWRFYKTGYALDDRILLEQLDTEVRLLLYRDNECEEYSGVVEE